MPDQVLFDNWIFMSEDTIQQLHQEDIFTTDQLCEKNFSELREIVGNSIAKEIKAELNEHQYYLRDSDAGANQKRRFALQSHT